MTNADKIRAMDNKQLADFLCSNVTDCSECKFDMWAGCRIHHWLAAEAQEEG